MTRVEEDDLQMRRCLYKEDVARYERRKTATWKLSTVIQETISHAYLFYTLTYNTPYEMLRALKKRLTPIDRASTMKLARKHHTQCVIASVYVASDRDYSHSLRNSFLLDQSPDSRL